MRLSISSNSCSRAVGFSAKSKRDSRFSTAWCIKGTLRLQEEAVSTESANALKVPHNDAGASGPVSGIIGRQGINAASGSVNGYNLKPAAGKGRLFCYQRS